LAKTCFLSTSKEASYEIFTLKKELLPLELSSVEGGDELLFCNNDYF
jgi:hypothetical protein